MARWGLVIAFDVGSVVQFDHDTTAFVRNLCEYDPSWTPASSNFDVVTGLPTPESISATGTSNPCSIASGPQLWYLADFQTCRILAFDPATGSVFATFGGRRGIGAGKINPDALRRSIVAFGNGKVFVTDNDDGLGGSGNGFVLQYSSGGTFEAEYSIASWISALALSFDQITGWVYDTARGRYWALAQGATTAYLFAVNLSGVPTGEVIDLTARLASSLGITVGGHNNSPADRVRTRGLYYNNGRMIFVSDGRLIRVDLANTDGDQLLVSEGNDLSPGNWTSDGTEASYVLQDQPNGAAVIYVRTLSTGITRSYGYAVSPPDGMDGHVGGPWDMTVAPTAEDPSTRTSRDLLMRARIQVTASAGLEMRASIQGTTSRTIDMRGRITSQTLRQITMRARIEEPTSLPDGVATAWSLDDSLGTYSRGLTLQTVGRAGLQVGDTVTLYAGYNQERVKIFHGEIDDMTNAVEPDSNVYTMTLRDVGAKDADSRLITRTWNAQFPVTADDIPSLTASQILAEASLAAGIAVGGGFPDYPMYGNFVVHNATPIQLLQNLAEPWNLFPSGQFYPTVRDGRLFTRGINWTNPPSNGYQIPRSRLKSITRRQTRYLQAPNLVPFTLLQVKGATLTLAIVDQLGLQTRVEYLRSLTEDSVTTPSPSSTGETTFAMQYVLTEQTNIEELWGDKVLLRTTETYETRLTSTGGGGGGNTKLIAREVEETLYFEPPGLLGFDSIQVASAGPSPLALPYQVNAIVSGIDPSDGRFKEMQRTQTNYNYDPRFQLASETTSVTSFDISINNWVLESVQTRFHSETTGGSTRVKRLLFNNDDGNLTFDTADGQQVGGRRPNPGIQSGLSSVVTFQCVAPEPQVTVDIFGSHVVDPGGDRFVWSYENPYLGQAECEAIQSLAATEQGIQSNPAQRWEELSLVAVFDPNLHSGMGVTIEVEEGIFLAYWLESVQHTWSVNEALTRANAKRITSTPLS